MGEVHFLFIIQFKLAIVPFKLNNRTTVDIKQWEL